MPAPRSRPRPGLGLFQGANQAYLFVVPEASSQKALTAEEAYFVFGFGAAGMAAALDRRDAVFHPHHHQEHPGGAGREHPGAGCQVEGRELDQSTEVVNGVASSVSPEKTIGILGAEIYENSRDKLNALAFQAYKQTQAYYPDSTAAARDKRNLRDGHYTPWSPTVYMTKVGGDGVPVNAAGQAAARPHPGRGR